MEPIPQDTLIEFKNGSVSAFEYILSAYERPIYNYILRIVRDTTPAKDITQDTFIKVYTNHTKVDTDKNIKSWIFTIATNTAYDFLRSPKGRKSINLEEDDETFYSRSTYSSIEGLVTDVGNALDAIKPDYRKPIILYYKEGFSYLEISEILSIPINTVKTHISRGKEQLKHLLKDYGTN